MSIQRLSNTVRVLAALGALTLLLLPPLFWSQPDWVESVVRRQFFAADITTIQLDAASRLGGFAATALQSLVGLWTMWEIWRLFGCFARGEVLAPRPARHLRRLGQSLVALAAAMPLGDTLTVLALTWGNPPGHRQLMLDIAGQHYMALLFGLMLIALAQVLGEAARVAQEHSEFV